MFLPAVIALVAENIGHVKSVGQMTGTDIDPLMGRALAADGVATDAGRLRRRFGHHHLRREHRRDGGDPRVYSTAAYWVAGSVAIVLSLCPKVGAAISAIPPGVLGAPWLLYGLVGILGVRIWLTNQVDFSKPVNQMTAAALIIGIADFTFNRRLDLRRHRARYDRRAGDLPRDEGRRTGPWHRPGGAGHHRRLRHPSARGRSGSLNRRPLAQSRPLVAVC